MRARRSIVTARCGCGRVRFERPGAECCRRAARSPKEGLVVVAVGEPRARPRCTPCANGRRLLGAPCPHGGESRAPCRTTAEARARARRGRRGRGSRGGQEARAAASPSVQPGGGGRTPLRAARGRAVLFPERGLGDRACARAQAEISHPPPPLKGTRTLEAIPGDGRAFARRGARAAIESNESIAFQP